MKITKVDCYQVVVLTHPDRVNSEDFGPAVFDETAKIVMEAYTDEGLVGLGETPRGTGEAYVRSTLSLLKDVELTEICFQEPPLCDMSENDMFGHEHPQRPNRLTERSFVSYSDQGFHALLLDLLGKKVGLPVSALMGGAYRDRVRVDYWMGRMTPEDSARVCKDAKELGYSGVKSKCALEDDNVERAQAILDVCGSDFKITFDPNSRFYRYGEAISMLKRLANVGNIGCVEDPFNKFDLEGYRLLRGHGLFPVALHLNYNSQLIDAIRGDACDFMNLGGLPWQVHHAGSTCWLAGIPTWHGSGLDLGITEAMMLHICAATKSMTRPSDILGRNIRQHNLVTNPFTVTDGTIQVPTAPGLGVELDRDALDRHTTNKFTINLAS